MHSPGPWTVFNNGNAHWQIQSAAVGKGYYSTIGSFCQRDVHPIHGGAIKTETAAANAQLAAAAPELLEALRGLLEECERHGSFAEVGFDFPTVKPFFDAARAAVAKAICR